MRPFHPFLCLLSLLFLSAGLSQALILPRRTAPSFRGAAVLPDQSTADISFPQDFEDRWTVLFWYPADFTFVCPTEIIGFSERKTDFEKLNAAIVGISTDSIHTHLAWTNTPRTEGGLGKVEIPLIGDSSKRISEKYGVLVQEETDSMYGLALRAVVIVDPKGIVRHASVNDDQVGRSVEEVLRLLQGLQEAERTGKVCPADWTPGAETIIPNHKDKTKFFAKAHSEL